MNLNFFFGIEVFGFAGIHQTQWGDGGVGYGEIRCQLQHSVSHFGDFFSLWEGVSE